jgi:hypothetical protein
MDEATRREALRRAAAAGVVALAGPAAGAAADEGKKSEGDWKAQERQRVMACGMTEAEADCWVLVAQAAGKFFELPKLHPMDEQEVSQAIHVVQNKLLGRPTYRRYKESFRKGKD